MRASWSSKHEPVKPGREIIRCKVWILVDNARTPQTLLHLHPRIALYPVAGLIHRARKQPQNSTAHSGAAATATSTAVASEPRRIARHQSRNVVKSSRRRCPTCLPPPTKVLSSLAFS